MRDIYELFSSAGHVITTDSRNCPPGAIFFALRGDNFNGNDYALKALDAGCSLAVVDDVKYKNTPGCYLVNNSLVALQDLATYHRIKVGAKVIAITGSNGKTTTKELISKVLSMKYKTWHTKGNLNNHIGVPLTLLSMPVDTQLAVIEMGANHLHEIELLSTICLPDYGLVTNVGKAHLEGFGSFEGVKAAKAELYTHLKERGGVIFINGDNPNLTGMFGKDSGSARYYGTNPNFDTICRHAMVNPMLSFEWKNKHDNWHEIITNLPGLYNLENVMAAICVGSFFVVPPGDIKDAIGNYKPENQRSQVVKTETNTVLLDAYNANPTSMEVALENFNAMEGKNKVLILGSMKELGAESELEHENLLKKVITTGISTCLIVGREYYGHLPAGKSAIKWFESTSTLIDFLKSNPLRDSFVLIKGSRANKLEEVMSQL